MQPYGEGNWFHSRVSTSEHERESIVTLVNASSNYIGLRWTGSKEHPQVIYFSQVIRVNPSQMQTKIRAFIRSGFIKHSNECPLEWTKLGNFWRTFVEQDEDGELNYLTTKLERLIVASSLSLYSFSSKGISSDPVNDYRPISRLFESLDSNGFISDEKIQSLIGKKGANHSNFSYWISDLQNAGFIRAVNGGFMITNEFPSLFNAIRSIPLPKGFSNSQWQNIQNDTLVQLNPYRDAILKELEVITSGTIELLEVEVPYVNPLIDELLDSPDVEEEGPEDPFNGDYTVPEDWGLVKKRKKQRKWAKRVKKDYGYNCCVPECDVTSDRFTVAAHIKPYSKKETPPGHRANLHNGLCMCLLCHAMFDNGYFTLTDNLEILVSDKINAISSSRLKNVIKDSEGKKLKPCKNSSSPDLSFIRFHRDWVFKK